MSLEGLVFNDSVKHIFLNLLTFSKPSKPFSNPSKLKNMSHKSKEFSISSWAVDNRVTVYILTLLIVITGVIAYVTMPREDFPEIIENKV